MAAYRTCMPAAILSAALVGGCAGAQTATLQSATLTASPPSAQPVAAAPPSTASVAASAASPEVAPAKKDKSQKISMKAPPAPGQMQPDGTYLMSKDELALDCKKLTGRVMVRILQMRNYEIRNPTTTAARTTQQVVTPIFGGTSYGADPDADYRRDRALVEAYNKRLAEKQCKVFDLVKELQPKPAGETPTPAKKTN